MTASISTESTEREAPPDDGGSSPVTGLVGADKAKKCSYCGRIYKAHQKNQRFCRRRCYDETYNAAHPVTRQRPLPLDPAPVRLPPVRDQHVPRRDRPRLCAMSRLVLARLRRGPVTNRELAAMFPDGAAWRTRVSDVRFYLLEFVETVVAEPLGAGLWCYRIKAL